MPSRQTYFNINWEVPSLRVHPRLANACNLLGHWGNDKILKYGLKTDHYLYVSWLRLALQDFADAFGAIKVKEHCN